MLKIKKKSEKEKEAKAKNQSHLKNFWKKKKKLCPKKKPTVFSFLFSVCYCYTSKKKQKFFSGVRNPFPRV